MHPFEEFVRSLGLRPRGVAADGRWRRCGTDNHPRKRNGAYKLAESGTIGWVQDWAIHEQPIQWTAGKDADIPDFDPDAMKRAWIEQEKRREKAVRAARRFYEECRPLMGGHPYLEAHGLDMEGCLGLKEDKDGWLVVPGYSDGLQTVQRISPNGDKRFWPGAPVSGTRYVIDRRQACVNVLCEGLATGLACYKAVPNSRVIVLWNTGNLTKVDGVPRGLTVIAADNDHGTEERRGENPGIKAAEQAAEALGCGVAYPEGIEGTDWADYRQERLAVLLERKSKFDTRSHLERDVDAEIRRALMSQARMCA